MRVKRAICKDILKILREKEVPGDQISKVLTCLTNYTYSSIIQGKPILRQETAQMAVQK